MTDTTPDLPTATVPAPGDAATPQPEVPPGGRFQLALRVPDVAAAAEFYAAALGVAPAKRRPGYVNFALAEPPLKLVLLEEGSSEASSDAGPTGRTALDHLGVEVPDTATVGRATDRLAAAGLATAVRDATTCCYAVQDKVVTRGPGGEVFEVYTVLADARPDLEGVTSPAATGVEETSVAGRGSQRPGDSCC